MSSRISPATPDLDIGYAELHAKTNFSFLEGASHADELIERAAELNYAALAVTDRNSLAGVVRAHGAAKDLGFKLILGAEITPEDAPPIVLWVTDRAAYGRLTRLITQGRRRAPKGECRLTLADVAEYAEGLVAGVSCTGLKPEAPARKYGEFLAGASGFNPTERLCKCPGQESSPSASDAGAQFARRLATIRDIFGDRCYLLAELHYGPDDQRQLDRWLDLSRESRLPLVAAGGVHYHIAERQSLSDVLTAIRHGCTVFEAGQRLFPNAQRHLRSLAEIRAIFARVPEAIRRSVEIAGRCTFSLDELRYEYPEELAPPGKTPLEHLRQLTENGAVQRYPKGVPQRVRQLIEHELQLIGELHYEAYFLTVWDLVRFARGRDILCQGRGSAANSAVCFCLGITSVDPERMDVLFERFVSRERNEAPDIDVDFEHERREEVLQYLYNKYGRERAGMTAEVITYRPRSAVRDVGKALGMPLEAIDRLAKHLEHFHLEKSVKTPAEQVGDCPNSGTMRSMVATKMGLPPSRDPATAPQDDRANSSRHTPCAMADGTRSVPATLNNPTHGPNLPLRCREAGIDPDSPQRRQFVALVEELVGFPRHLSQHTGGMVMTRGPLCELVPIENAAMPDRTVIQWNKDDLDELGILKVDCLALGMLTAIRKCFALVEQHYGRQLTLATIPEGDADVYAMICRADTMGVFQIESRAQMSMLPRLRPACFYDLVIEVAIVRPGPIQGNMVHPYLRRRNGEEPVTFPNERVRQVLEKTLGVPLFQEQAMRLAVEAAGFTPGEADQLRRAMGAWRRPGVIDQFRRKLVEGMLARGFSAEYAASVFTQIRGFGDYGFPESHAASFALLVYVSAWLKHHYPAAFATALLNSQPLGFYAPAQLVRNVQEHGVTVLPVDVNHSDWDCTMEGGDSGQGTGNREERIGDRELESGISAASYPLSTTHCPLAVRLGFRMLSGLARNYAQQIVAARDQRPFRSMEEFARRTGLSRAVLMRLSKAGVFDSLRTRRRQSLWEALGQDQKEMPLFDIASHQATESSREEEEPEVALPRMSPLEEVVADYRTLGLSLQGHPLEFFREALNRMRVVPAVALKRWPHGKRVRVAGLVLVRQRPGTAKGITFVTLEDETGTVNLIIRPGIWQRFRSAAIGATILLVEGALQRQGETIHVIATRLEDFSTPLGKMPPQSRDFC